LIKQTDDERSGVVSFSVSGPFLLSELRATLAELFASRPEELPKRFLWDLRTAEIEWSSGDIKQFSEWVSANRQSGEGRTAVVVAEDFHFGLARMYEVFSSDVPVEFVVFRDLESAKTWVTH
jgi:hypothetical protein